LHPSASGRHDYFAGTGFTVLIRVFAGLIDIEGMMGMLEGGNAQATSDQEWNELDE
jgi:hypothetical protein